MKADAVAAHRPLFVVLLVLFDALVVVSVLTLWSIDRRRFSPFEDAAAITLGFSVIGLLVLWWILRRSQKRLSSVCLLSAVAGFLGSIVLPAVP